jgi:hypothetical protein
MLESWRGLSKKFTGLKYSDLSWMRFKFYPLAFTRSAILSSWNRVARLPEKMEKYVYTLERNIFKSTHTHIHEWSLREQKRRRKKWTRNHFCYFSRILVFRTFLPKAQFNSSRKSEWRTKNVHICQPYPYDKKWRKFLKQGWVVVHSTWTFYEDNILKNINILILRSCTCYTILLNFRASLVWPKLVWPNARLDETNLAEKWPKIL